MEQLDKIKQALIQLKPELAPKFYVPTIGLSGSVVRNDLSPDSDADLIIDFRQPIGIGFIDGAHFTERRL